MRSSGTEPSSVILRQKVVSKVGKWGPKNTKLGWSQKGWCDKPTKLHFQLIEYWKDYSFGVGKKTKKNFT